MKNIIKKIFNKFLKEDYEIYLVGGYVRDYLLGNKNDDLDFATNAHVVDMQRILNEFHIVYINSKLGSLVLNINNHNIQITSFRSEEKYLDKRHPSEVIFVESLVKDVKRRDFTINALAMDENGEIYDYVKGIEDLNNQEIKTINNPIISFNDDALRILRAIRFKLYLNFNYEEKTKEAIYKCRENLKFLSRNKLMEEVDKILFMDIGNVLELQKFDLIKYIFIDADVDNDKLAKIVEYIKQIKYPIKFKHYLLYLLIYDDYDDFEKFIKLSIFKQKTIKSLLKIKRSSYLTYQSIKDAIIDLKIRQELSNEELFYLSLLKKNWFHSTIYIMARELEKRNAPTSLRDLNIDGNDIIRLYPDIDRRILAKLLSELLYLAYLKPELNKKEELIEIIKERLI